ncbi:MAG: hypothetical protein V4565_05145 [Bacteroidota bacterium]
MKKIAVITLIFFSIPLIQCKKEKKTCTESRTGAVCADNSTTTATGSGACSGHGGVKEWTTKEECK